MPRQAGRSSVFFLGACQGCQAQALRLCGLEKLLVVFGVHSSQEQAQAILGRPLRGPALRGGAGL